MLKDAKSSKPIRIKRWELNPEPIVDEPEIEESDSDQPSTTTEGTYGIIFLPFIGAAFLAHSHYSPNNLMSVAKSKSLLCFSSSLDC